MSKKASNQKSAKGAKGAPNMISKYYDTSSGKIKCLKHTCPRCGDGVFLADHKNRRTCGKCAYTELLK